VTRPRRRVIEIGSYASVGLLNKGKLGLGANFAVERPILLIKANRQNGNEHAVSNEPMFPESLVRC